MISDLDKQTLRHVILETLAVRHPNALTRKQVLNRSAMEVDFSIDLTDIVRALQFLHGLGQLANEPDPFGATDYWTITSSGLLAHERRLAK